MDQEIEQVVKEVLEKGYLMTLAFKDSLGIWACDVIYIYDDHYNLYWMSSPRVRHSKAVLENPEFAGTITVSDLGQNNLGMQFSGIAEKIEGPRYDLALKFFKKRNKLQPKETDDILEGDSWYMLKPKKIDVICEQLWGFKKQKIEF